METTAAKIRTHAYQQTNKKSMPGRYAPIEWYRYDAGTWVLMGQIIFKK